MKLFAYIMAFIVLGLTAIPCADVPDDHSVQKIELSNKTADHHHSEEDHCSPFCTCHCCQASFYVCDINMTFSMETVEICYMESSARFQDVELFDFLIPPKA